MSWSGWALPWGKDNLLMPVGLYARDVLEMARQFIDLANLGNETVRRSLDAFLADENQVVMAVEDRNKACIQPFFFSNAFHGKQEEYAQAGVRYAMDLARFKNQVLYKLVEKLDVGFGQFFEFGEEAGYGPTSYFVSAEGFFYVLTYRAADVAQRKFESTPRWTLQALD